MMERPDFTVQMFNVGDQVIVCSKSPPSGSPFGWDSKMSDFCGKIATVTRAWIAIGDWAYTIDIDQGEWMWNNETILPIDDSFKPFESADDSALAELFS